MDTIIRGGIVFLSNGDERRADLWIKGGKIYYIHDQIKDKPSIRVVDATGLGIFPGMIYEFPLWTIVRNQKRYRNQLVSILENGYTSFVDTILWSPNQSFEQTLSYYKALHANSPIDYTFQLYIPIQFLTLALIREAKKNHIHQFVIGVQHVEQLFNKEWHWIAHLKQEYKLNFYLLPHPSYYDVKEGRKMIEEILNSWYYLNDSLKLNHGIIEHKFLTTYPTRTTIEMEDRFILKFAQNPAKRAGLYPYKGSIAIGSDADLVLISLESLKNKHVFDPKMIIIDGKLHEIPLHEISFGSGKYRKPHTTYAIYS